MGTGLLYGKNAFWLTRDFSPDAAARLWLCLYISHLELVIGSKDSLCRDACALFSWLSFFMISLRFPFCSNFYYE